MIKTFTCLSVLVCISSPSFAQCIEWDFRNDIAFVCGRESAGHQAACRAVKNRDMNLFGRLFKGSQKNSNTRDNFEHCANSPDGALLKVTTEICPDICKRNGDW
jgi:hypothetical protein